MVRGIGIDGNAEENVQIDIKLSAKTDTCGESKCELEAVEVTTKAEAYVSL
ncbi:MULTISPECIES: hypothetical protein [unclassified Photobacterium]|uniref:hypothetical protein n=1 Tax=unclassified Photobacterium TaxID=2628852 RepID=UPI001304C6F8|nr:MULTISPECIES: hypothetical protein [unclassified Photobacterium]